MIGTGCCCDKAEEMKVNTRMDWFFLKRHFSGMANFGPKWLNIKYFVIWTKFDPTKKHSSPEIFDEKNVKKSENGNKPAKNTLGIAFLQ
jgi:hypothetical protein